MGPENTSKLKIDAGVKTHASRSMAYLTYVPLF